MLKRIRIEVEEETADEAVAALSRYEAIVQAAEVERYGLFVEGEDVFQSWRTDLHAGLNFHNGELGRDLVEEVIEYDAGAAAYRGRRVVRFVRIDTRSAAFQEGWDSRPIKEMK